MATATATGTSIADSGLAAIQGRQKSLHTFSDAANHLFPPVAKFNVGAALLYNIVVTLPTHHPSPPMNNRQKQNRKSSPIVARVARSGT